MPDAPEGTSDKPNPDPAPDPKGFTQEDVNRIVARERKKFEEEIASRPTKEEFDKLQEQLAHISQESELRGKSEIEKIQIQHSREVEKLNHKLEQIAAEAKVKEEAVAAAQNTLRTERLRRAFGAALSKAEVFGGASDDALETLIAKVKEVDINDDGVIRASYGDLLDESPEEIAKKFLEDRPYFASAKVGGAGTQPPTGKPRTSESIADASTEELWAAAGEDPSLALPHQR